MNGHSRLHHAGSNAMDRKLSRYLSAMLIVFFAVGIRVALDALIGADEPYLTVYLSLVFVSVLFGLGPAVAGGVVGVIGTEFLDLEPRFGITFGLEFMARGSVVMISAAYLGYIGDKLRRSERNLSLRLSDIQRSKELSDALNREITAAHTALQESERRLKDILNTIPDMAWLKDRESRYILLNEALGSSIGMDPGELTGKTDLDIWPGELAEKFRADDREVMKSNERKRIEEHIEDKGGKIRWLETIKTPLRNEQGEVIGTVGIARDITERRRMEQEIRHLAHHDPLTGLANRRLFVDILALELAQARRHKSKIAILFLDLDRFKEVNDTLGHDAGDQLLKKVAARLKKTMREADTLARIGGDEFNIVLADISRSEAISEIAQKILQSLREPFIIGKNQLHISASIGISISPDDADQIDPLLRYSDIAMYHAKQGGRNTYQFYNPSINIRSLERMRLENMLLRSLEFGEMVLYYQPLMSMSDRRIVCAEALIRWRHPQKGLLLPKDFIHAAEASGFITAIDRWALETVCRQVRAWKEAGLTPVCVTVNVSARQFQSPGLAGIIGAALRDSGIPADCLDIEIPESMAMSNVERSAEAMRELSRMGVHISIDDFGTGYSSLNYLKRLPIERIKIDRSFIEDITVDRDDRAIISAITSMARKMGIRTVAEGVETEEQLELLRAAECDEAQGFLFSRPVPAEQFMELMAQK